ncbi:TraI domain-containing protein [Undibacterium oligocarboniphilum]|uniref:TraI domain-containing protein n=1 Tax=Undibacterium oligocarboniphilum TaxID=666702 RepID=A0A850QQF6_9BURK|nr:TraI domain-containing protein [Undibacterium oligocarboniphilum]MBC3871414.1 TraI domain-containing protein [Undibacterium oligocarboniphilum]NVO79010.1 TraI domain-containing protein [Undibacterium oligocarboniphilum]
MQILSVDELLHLNKKKLDLIEFSSDTDYQNACLPLIKIMARWFNALPLGSSYYDEPGGAFRCCVESVYFSIRQAKSAIFTSHLTSEQARMLEPQYQYAAFLSSIVSWIDEPFRIFDVSVNGEFFNPLNDSDLSSFLDGSQEFVLERKPIELQPSRQRTVVYSSQILKPYLQYLMPVVQESLFEAINPERRAVSNEGVLQKVIRKGLLQAEEFERKSKDLLVTPVSRDVSTSKMMEQSVEASVSPIIPESKSESVQSPKVSKVPDQGSESPKMEEKQIRLKLSSGDAIPSMSKQSQDVLAAVAADMREGKLDSNLVEWMSSGLRIPKKFFKGFGRSFQTIIEDLRVQKIIVGSDENSVLICTAVGDLILPKGESE